jgi:P27 family predicted phage terminase small subunit
MAKPRKPTRLRLVTGGRTRRHHVAEEVQPDPTMPSPPAWLQGHGLKAWNEVARPLHTLGVFTSLDRDILAAWASATGMVAEAQEQLNQMPEGNRLLLKSKRGRPLVNPLVGVIQKAQKDAIHYGNLLGLSPSARASLVTPSPQKRGDLDEFFA